MRNNKIKALNKQTILIAITTVFLSGCNLTDVNEMRALSQPQIKCNYKKIKVSNINQEFSGGVNWIASCNNQKFICHYDVDPKKSLPHDAAMSGSCRRL